MSGEQRIGAAGEFHQAVRRHHYTREAVQAAATQTPLEADVPRERFHHGRTPPSVSGAPRAPHSVITALPHEYHEGAVHVTHVSAKGKRHTTRIPLADYHDQSVMAARQAAEAHFVRAE